jgi:hypothetical protein
MRLPLKKKPGDPVLAEDWNLLLDAIAARTPRPGNGLELIASSGGFAYSRPGPPAAPFQHLPPFAVIGIEKGGEDDPGPYLVTVKEGWVIERKPKTGDAPTVKFHIPRAGAVTLDTIPRPQIAMSIGDTLWCRYSTDIAGEINGEPTVVAIAADQNGNHYYPEDPAGSGGPGEIFVKLFKLEEENGSPRVKVYQQSDIEHWAQLWTGRNKGGGARVYKEHAETENIYYFRTLKPRETQHQIEVIEEGDVIRVQGNGKQGTLLLEGPGAPSEPLLEWQDGLVTTDGEKKLAVKEYLVCEYGEPTAVKFIVLE